MERDELLGELRGLADRRSDLLRDRIGKLSPDDTAAALFEFVVIDAVRRAAQAPLEPATTPPANPDALAALLDDAKRLGDALDDIDNFEGLVAGAFDALTPGEAHMVVFERSFRRMWERRIRRREQDGDDVA